MSSERKLELRPGQNCIGSIAIYGLYCFSSCLCAEKYVNLSSGASSTKRLLSDDQEVSDESEQFFQRKDNDVLLLWCS